MRSDRATIAAFALAGLMLAAGCVQTPPEEKPAETAAVEGEGSEGEEARPSLMYNGTAVLPPVNSDPEQLIGLAGPALDAKLGKPALIRRESGAEVWQYRADNCVLDVFLYGSGKTVEHVDLRDRGGASDTAVRDCFVSLLRAALPES